MIRGMPNGQAPKFRHVMTEYLRHRLYHLLFQRRQGNAVYFCPFLMLMLVILQMMISNTANAGILSLLINGKSLHMNPPKDVEYNENNWGAGVQYDFKSYGNAWIPFLTASGFVDSFENPSYYTGAGIVRRFHFGQTKDSTHFDAGIIGFLMTRQDYRGGDPFFGMLPALSYGNRRFAVNMTYIPKVQPKLVALWFFQFKISTAGF